MRSNARCQKDQDIASLLMVYNKILTAGRRNLTTFLPFLVYNLYNLATKIKSRG
jgi:hypothetical protein